MLNDRPTLADQVTISKMTDDELIDCFMPHGFWQKLDFWIFGCHLLWNIIHWKWLDLRTDTYSFKEYWKSVWLKIRRKVK